MYGSYVLSNTASVTMTGGDPYKRLAPLCRSALEKFINPESAIYDRQIRNGRVETTWGTESLTSTCICLIAIDRHEPDPNSLLKAPRLTLEAVTALAARRRYLGAFGLLVWANAVNDGIDIEELAGRTRTPLNEEGYVRRLTTMELAWLTSGLLHELERTRSTRIHRLARSALVALCDRYNPNSGIMRHAVRGARLSHRVRGQIANFADQIYAVQALGFAAIALADGQALQLAVRLARRLISLQGPLGQWWWHYDAVTGMPVEAYPVYSVHQHSMAPMALMTVEKAGGPSFTPALSASHSWLDRNELGIRMVDCTAGTIWRDIQRSDGRVQSLLRKARELTGLHRDDVPTEGTGLKLNRETRPYEWAWCLYSGAVSHRLERKRHLV